MRNIGVMKLLVTIFMANIIESYMAPILIKAYINVPITFLIFSFVTYKPNKKAYKAFVLNLDLYITKLNNKKVIGIFI